MSKLKATTPLALLLAAALGCGGGDGGTPPSTTVIAKIPAGSGDAQSGQVGQALIDPLRVVVTEGGTPLSGATVTWSTTATGGNVDPATVVTGADGVASTTWTLGTVAGAQTATATLSGASGSPVSFSASALAGPAAALVQVAGNEQIGEINTPLAEPLQASVTDEFGNPVAGVVVAWAATGATLSAATDITDANGIADVTVTLGGTAGAVTITAASDGLPGSPVTFTAMATAPAPIPPSASVTVRDNNFLSVRNGTTNPAVDTVAAGGTVTWTWAPSTGASHNITSTGSPSFTGRGTVTPPPTPAPHEVDFSAPGTYNYYCTIHGSPSSGMRGRIVVR